LFSADPIEEVVEMAGIQWKKKKKKKWKQLRKMHQKKLKQKVAENVLLQRKSQRTQPPQMLTTRKV
jgi:mRNA-degrading endonuclease RelE of RelBE toxin-antitoxin system